MRRWGFRLVVAALVILGLLLCDYLNLVKYAIETGMRFAMGAPVSIDTITFHPKERALNITGFKLHNPDGFPEGRMLNADETEIVFAKPILYRKRLHVEQVTTDIEQIAVIKRKDGKMNVDSLKFFKDPANIPQIGNLKYFDEKKRVHIDTLVMSVKQVVYVDKSFKEGAQTQVYDVNIRNRVYKNIPGFDILIIFILREAITQAAIKGAVILGAAAVTTAAFWPATVGVIFLSKDSAKVDFNADFDTVYNASVQTLRSMGEIHANDREKGIIHASYHGNNITLRVKDKDGKTEVRATSRKLLVPTRLTAQKVLYRISQALPD